MYPDTSSPASGSDNPLLSNWNTPHQTPPFSRICSEHYVPALRVALQEAERAVQEIAGRPEPPTFENSVVALECATFSLDRISNLLFNLNECHTDDTMQHIAEQMAPELTRFSNRIYMDERLFGRIDTLYQQRDTLELDGEQRTLLEETRKAFVRHGVSLQGDARRRFEVISERLAVLSQNFSRHVLADSNDYALHLTDSAQLNGLPDHVVAAASQEAGRRGLKGWVFTLSYPSYGPFVTYSDQRELRRQMWCAYNSRGNRGNENDNNALVAEIVALRHELAGLLGYDTYCDYVVSNRMVGSRARLESFMAELHAAALPVARRDFDEVVRYATAQGAEMPLQRWDYNYYAERLKRERYGFDFEQLRPFFPLDRVCQGIFGLYGRLYGLRFQPSDQIETYHPEVQVFEVYEGDRLMGVLYLDLHPRSNKRSGAWMTEFRDQSCVNGMEVRPLIQIVCNFSRPVEGRPALLSLNEVETFMHEFGHAMHGMLSEVTYPSLSGTHVKRDFVELPSQLMENWCRERSFLDTFARHYETGAMLPDDYLDHIRNSERYQAGYLCLRQWNFGIVDLAFHTLSAPLQHSVAAFEQEHMDELLPVVAGCAASTAFTHIFSGGYAAGYYGYKWAEVLDADVFERFRQTGIFDCATATAWRQKVLSRGGTRPPNQLFRDFMGRDPDMTAFLKRSFQP